METPITFSELHLDPAVEKAITACGYTTPTPVQAESIPVVLAGKDVVVSAQTGTGKTAAFVLPALHHLLQSEQKVRKARILILTPTRELAAQITKAAAQYGKFCRFNIISLVGGMPYHNQLRDLQRGADIIVATPGRLMDHMEQKRVDLSGIDMLILDEADRMCDMGFIDDVQYIAKLTPSKRQTLLFSATVDKQLTSIVRNLLKEPVRIDLSNKKITATNVEQIFYKATSPHHKMRLLKEILSEGNMYKAIIFSATKINADKLTAQLCADGFSAAAIHGDLRQNVRTRTLDNLRRGKIQFLVATDVAARGIDINDITHVINYDLPKFSEDYVHRIGRTARAGKNGVAISFVLPSDTRHVQRIEKYIGQRVKIVAGPNTPAGETTTDEFATPQRERRTERPFQSRSEDEAAPRFKKKSFSSKRSSFEDSFKPAGGEKKRYASSRPDATPFSSKRKFDGDRNESPFKSERPAKRKFEGGRSESSFSADRPVRRKFEGDRSDSPFNADRPVKRKFSGDRSESSFSTDRPVRRKFDGDRKESTFRSERPARRKFDGDRAESGFSAERPSRRKFDGEKRETTVTTRESRRKPFEKESAPRGKKFGSEKRAPFASAGKSDSARKPFGSDKPARRSIGGDSGRPFKKKTGEGRPFAKSNRERTR